MSKLELAELANTNFDEGEHSNSRIINMNINKTNNFLKTGVAIIPGFQGILIMAI